MQLALYWFGLGLIAAAVARDDRPRSAWAVLAIGACPLVLGWQATILKDAQMVGAMLSATAIIAWYRLGDRPVAWYGWGVVIVLLGYAVLVRSNAVFAVVPLVVALVPGPDWLLRRVASGLVATGLVIGASPVINHYWLGASTSPVTRALPTFDLVGIAHFARDPRDLPPAIVASRRCYTPFFWDPLGEPKHCGAAFAAMNREHPGELTSQWLIAVGHHPVAYLRHRLAHLNNTERLIVPRGLISATPPSRSEPNIFGLGDPGGGAPLVATVGGWIAETPVGWPATSMATALLILLRAGSVRKRGLRRLIQALSLSALLLEASFAVVSIASDLRYHLWPMLATALALVLVVGTEVAPSGWWRRTIAVLGLVIVIGITARLVQPLAPSSYQAMLGS